MDFLVDSMSAKLSPLRGIFDTSNVLREKLYDIAYKCDWSGNTINPINRAVSHITLVGVSTAYTHYLKQLTKTEQDQILDNLLTLAIELEQ